ncbi:MAG: hypothetical protein HQM16_07490 [Deltaproteobacteria bacterium]|nr:hypothetical protein [Deltaproteobacteria bacterium]
MQFIRTSKFYCLVIGLLCPAFFSACEVEWYEDGCYDSVDSGYVYEEYTEEVEESDADDTSGGIKIWSDYYKGSGRDYYGEFRLDTWRTTCDDNGYDGPGLELPAYLMLYSYDDMMDFETSASDLVWNAEMSYNNTFSFETNYLDWYGDLSVYFPCSCSIENAGYSDETIECSCHPSNTYGSCSFYYEVI